MKNSDNETIYDQNFKINLLEEENAKLSIKEDNY